MILISLTDGAWSQWGEWCKCPNTRSRVRTCRNPFTNATALDCPGPSEERNNEVTYQKGTVFLSSWICIIENTNPFKNARKTISITYSIYIAIYFFSSDKLFRCFALWL